LHIYAMFGDLNYLNLGVENNMIESELKL